MLEVVDIKVYVNESATILSTPMSLYQLRDAYYPSADVTIVNGYQYREDIDLKADDRVVFIERGRVPSEDEISCLIRARHTPGVHDKVKSARVAIAGLGGLGSNIGMSLARIGVGYIRIIDFDVVEPSNINRQHYMLSHIGENKCDALMDQIRQVNPYIQVDAINKKITPTNCIDLFSDVDIVVEAFDCPNTKASIIEQVMMELPTIPIVAASGMAGYYSNNSIITNRLMSNLYVIGDGENEAKEYDGLMAPRVLIAAGHQANTVLRIIMNEREV